MVLDRVMTAVLLIRLVSCATVPPPENVTVSCQNQKITAHWDYSKQQPQTTFRVEVIASTGSKSDGETTDHQYDLSHFVWQSEENYMSFMYISVTAIQGDHESDAIKSNSFSFNDLKTADTKCVLDFPAISINTDDTGTSVKFQNPLHFYKDLKQTVKPHAPAKLIFSVSLAGNNGDFEGVCDATQSYCKRDVTFPEGAEQCFTVDGQLFDGSEINFVLFGKTDQFCVTKTDESLVIVAVILGSIFAIILILVVIAICKVKAWTMHIKLPQSLENIETQPPRYVTVPEERIISLSNDGKFHKTSSVNSEDNSAQSDSSLAVGCPCVEMENLLEGHNRGRGADGPRSGDSSMDDDYEKTECASIHSEDEEQEPVSPYDAPHNLVIDMGEGDVVTAYTG